MGSSMRKRPPTTAPVGIWAPCPGGCPDGEDVPGKSPAGIIGEGRLYQNSFVSEARTAGTGLGKPAISARSCHAGGYLDSRTTGSFFASSIQYCNWGSAGGFSVIFLAWLALATAADSPATSFLASSSVDLTPLASSSRTISDPTPLRRSRSQRRASDSRAGAARPDALARALRSLALAALSSSCSVVVTPAFCS